MEYFGVVVIYLAGGLLFTLSAWVQMDERTELWLYGLLWLMWLPVLVIWLIWKVATTKV